MIFEWRRSNGSIKRHRDGFEGILPPMERQYAEGRSQIVRKRLAPFMRVGLCPACEGTRLKPEALSVKIEGHTLPDVTAMTVDRAYAFFQSLKLTEVQARIAEDAMKEIRGRLKFLLDVGSRLSHTQPHGHPRYRAARHNAFRPRQPDWVWIGGCDLCIGRTVNWPAPPRQSAVARRPVQPAGRGQYRDRGRTRRRHHAACGSGDRLWTWSWAHRGSSSRRGIVETGREKNALGDRSLSIGKRKNSSARKAPRIASRLMDPGRGLKIISKIST